MAGGQAHLNHHEKAGPDVDRIHQPHPEPTPTHERAGQPGPQPQPMPAPRPHPEDTLPRRTPGASL